MRALKRLGIVTTAAIIATMGMAGVANAAHVTCGTTITTNTTLDSNVGPCSSTAITFGADNITLNLNGFQVFGIRGVSGEGPGILLSGRTNDRVINGTVSDFDAGIAIVGGSRNIVQGVTATLNEGSSATDFGDGIAISASNENVIQGNTVTRNAPFDGIGLFGGSSRNRIEGNVVSDNQGLRTIGPHGTTEEDDGIRLENFSTFNVVRGNTVERNGLDGIAVFFRATDNIIEGNTVRANGFHDPLPPPNRPGDGIRLFLQADRNIVRGNTSENNAKFGIGVDSFFNQIVSNRATGNVLFDLFDNSPDCDANVWASNVFVTRNVPCIN